MNDQDRQDFVPGQTISPRAAGPLSTSGLRQPERPTSVQPVPPVPLPAPDEAAKPDVPIDSPEPKAASGHSLFHDDTAAQPAYVQHYDQPEVLEPRMQDDSHAVSWTASEFIAHDKSAAWYGLLGVGTVIVAGLVYLMTRDFIATFVVVFCAVILGVMAARKPRQMRYVLDGRGITVGLKFFPYQHYRSFATVYEGHFRSITFMPLKRFATPLSIFYDPADEQRIINALASHLPMQDYKHDAIDSLMRRIRF